MPIARRLIGAAWRAGTGPLAGPTALLCRAAGEPGQAPPGAAVFGKSPALGAAGSGPRMQAADHVMPAAMTGAGWNHERS